MRKYIALPILLLLSACSGIGYTLVPADKPQKMGFYTVTPSSEWNRYARTGGGHERWTIDGFMLQNLRFFNGIEDGKPLLPPAPGRKKEKLPVFRKAMTASEIQEFTVDTFARAGFADVRATGLAPARFAGLPGFRFSMNMATSEGLDFQGLVLGVVKDDRLHLIVYTGASQYYFPAHLEAVEQILASIETSS